MKTATIIARAEDGSVFEYEVAAREIEKEVAEAEAAGLEVVDVR